MLLCVAIPKMWFVLAVSAVLAASCSGQISSPCPSLFKYLSLNPGKWEGEITLLSDTDLHGVWVRLLFDVPSAKVEVPDKFGDIVTNDQVDYLLKNRDFVLKAQEARKVKLVVSYEGDRAPKLTGFRLNARTVCPEHGGEFSWTDASNQPSKEFFLGDLSNKDFLSSRPVPAAVTGCGTVPLHPGALGAGKTSSEGQWPWHASIYLSKSNERKRICTATLISPSYLITAAHCVTLKNSNTPLNVDTVAVRLGEYLSNQENKGSQERQVLSIAVHPGYNSFNFDNDVAIVKLDKAATVSDYVRPVCLWEESPAVGNIFRREGVIPGFGFDSEGRYTDRITQSQLKVASPDVCINGNPQLAAFLNEKTICARYPKGNGLCVGESGSGYEFLSDGQKPVWQLRGLVTVGAALQNNLVCNENSFIVITDLTRYAEWIKKTIV